MRRRALTFAVVLAAAAAVPAAAQDSVPQPGGVRLTLRYDPGNRPSLVIVPGAGLDSVRTILKRDLDFSDRFTTIIQPEAESVAAGPAAPLNYGLYKNFGAAFALELVQSAGQTTLRLHDVNAGKVINTMDTRFADASDPALRMQVHRASDEVVRWVTGRRSGGHADRLRRRRSHHADGFRWRGDHGAHARGPDGPFTCLVADIGSHCVYTVG